MQSFAFPFAAALALVPTPSLTDGATTRVHIETQNPAVTLEQMLPPVDGEPPVYERVCVAPCDAVLPLGRNYRIAGDGIVETFAFALHGPSTVLTVNPGSKPVQTAGAIIAILAFTGAVVGLGGLAYELIARPVQSASDRATSMGFAGVLGGGFAVGFVGVGVLGASNTSVHDEVQQNLSRVSRTSGVTATFRF